VVEAAASCPQDIHIVAFDGPVEGEDRVQAWDAFLESGRSTLEAEDDDAFRASALQAQPHDVATILYTSGTTGQPKGVMLTHNNVASNVRAVADVLHQKPRTRLGPGDSTVSFLPLSHILQRMADFLFFRRGLTIAYPRSMATLVEDLGTLGPTVVVSVPRIYEKIYGGIVSATGLKKKIVFWAIGIADQVATERLAGRTPGGWLAFRYRIADKLVFSKVKRAVGGRLRYFVSGGGPLAPALNRFFYSIGLQVLEGYGLTETSPVTNVNTIEEFRIGSVGQPLPGTEIRIASDGEILIRGPQVMKGYYKNPEATAAVLDSDGWFSTGDIGEIDDDGFLKITDRKKDLLVTAGGKNVAPQPIENLVKTHPLVEQAILVGDARPFCAMMIVPAFPVLEAWAQDAGIAYSSVADLVAQPAVVDHIRTQVEPMLRDLASFEKPKSFALLDEEFTIDNGFLTPTLKVKRNVVRERLGHVIDGIYAGASGSSQS
jgi:long-chain acyl-CoA synthetase